MSVCSQVQQLRLQGEMYDKMALWRDGGSASPVTAGLFYETGTDVMEDEHCLKLASPKAHLTEAERDSKSADSCVEKLGKRWLWFKLQVSSQ